MQAAIEKRDGVVSQPAQKPPQPRGVHAALRIVGDNLLAFVQSDAREFGHQIRAIGQRMPSVRAGRRPRQIAVQMQVKGARHMTGRIRGFTRLRRGEIEAAIEDEHAAGRGGEPFGEIGGGNERGVVGVRHDSS